MLLRIAVISLIGLVLTVPIVLAQDGTHGHGHGRVFVGVGFGGYYGPPAYYPYPAYYYPPPSYYYPPPPPGV